MTDPDKSHRLSSLGAFATGDTLREVARDMDVALYRRYSVAEAVKILSVSEKELEALRAEGRIAYLRIGGERIGFFGCQLLTYLLECVVPAGAESRPSQPLAPAPSSPVISPEAELVSVNDTLTLLGIGRTKLYELLNANEIESVKIGKRTLVKRASLRRLTETQPE